VPNGKPADHPYTVYSPRAANLCAKLLSSLMTRPEASSPFDRPDVNKLDAVPTDMRDAALQEARARI
jgi:hypothetical protein